MLRQGEWNNPSSCKDVKMYNYCGKPSHIARFCYKAKNNNQENAYNTKNDDDTAFATQHVIHLGAVFLFLFLFFS